jgi:hypothetical protein
MVVDRDRPSHDLDHLGSEEGKHGRIRDPERCVPADPHVREPRSFELLGEDTLRQSTRYSAGPGALVVGDLRGELALDREVGHTDPAPRPEHTEDLCQGPALARRKVEDAVGDHNVY